MAVRVDVGKYGETARSAHSLEALYERHAPVLRQRCLHLTRDTSAAEDLMQEVFVRFIARFPDPPSDMHVAAYLHATARNILWKQLRDGHEFAESEIETRIGADDQLERDPERSALLVEQRHLVRRCAALLTGRQRQALTLREVQGHSYAEIGKELGIGSDAVAQVIVRARARLRGALRRAQIDLDQLPAECRAMLGPLSDYVDGRASSTTEIEAHLATCETCRGTVSAYQEAGSRLRGAGPLAPLAGLLARLGQLAGGGADGPLGLGAAVSVAVAVIAVGGGGLLAARHLTEAETASPARTTAGPHRPTGLSRAHRMNSIPATSGVTRVVANVPSVLPARLRKARPHPVSRRKHTAATPAAAAASPAATPVPAGPETVPAHARAVPPATSATAKAIPPVGAIPPVDNLPPVDTPVTGVLAPVREGVTTPAVTVPSVNTPAVTTPAVTVPSVTVPPITTPGVTSPLGNVAPVTTPAIATPAVTVPGVTVPGITTPSVSVPSLTTPKLP